ncbi:MAG: hypothetical protein ACK4ND_15465 [Cytophagaceae bacterium]
MDILKEIIECLEEQEKKEFRIFVNRYRRRSSRVDLKLFNLYCKEESLKRESLIKNLYGSSFKIEAYHGTRKRLIRTLVEFIPLQLKQINTESERSIENLLFVTSYLFEHQKNAVAWNFLKQAEELAKKTENYNLLNSIYSMQIQNYEMDSAGDLKQLIETKELCQQKALEDDNANIAYQIIRFELEKAKREGIEINLDKISQHVLEEYHFDTNVLSRPKLLHNLIAITRSARLSRKEFFMFEPYIEQKYLDVEAKNLFNEFNHHYKVNMLYMLAHVKYRNKKFNETIDYLNRLFENLCHYSRSQFNRFYPKYVLLLAAVKAYSGENLEAAVLLENLLNDKKIKLDHPVYLNACLNLVTYYFQMEEYNKAIKMFLNIGHSDNRLTKIMGREWVMKKSLAEILIQFELGNSEIVDQRIKSACKTFNDIFHRPVYKRVETYLLLVKALNNNPSIASTAEFRKRVEDAFEYVSMEEEDLQATTAFCWIKAKIQNKKYYDVLVHTVNFRYREQLV